MNIYVPQTMLLVAGVCVFIFLFLLLFGYLLWCERRKGRFSPFTENFFRLPGHSTRVYQEDVVGELLGCYLVFIFISAVVVWSFVYASVNIVVVVGCLIGLLYLCYRACRLFKQAQDYRLGYEGEEFTGQELNLLMRKGAYVFHDIPYKYGNIDHIVVGLDKVFIIETKTIRKPKKKASSHAAREAKVVYDGVNLKFPHFTTSKPLDQVGIAVKYVQDALSKKLGKPFSIVPVVALPGWYVESTTTASNDVLVINPKRGNALRSHMGQVEDYELRQQVVRYFAAVSRSYRPGSRVADSNAAERYDFWHSPKEAPDLHWDN